VNTGTDVLVEKDRIADVITRLFVFTDERDWGRVRPCLTDRVLLDMRSIIGGEPSLVPAEDLIAGWNQGLRPIKVVHHQIGNLLIDVDGAEANAFCYGIATHYLPNPTNQNERVFVGSYNLHLREIDGEWRIDQFRFNLKYIEGNRDLEKSV
jgi:hypothetical protein